MAGSGSFLAVPSQGHAGGSSVHQRPCPKLGRRPPWRVWLVAEIRENWLETPGTRFALTKPGEPVLKPIKPIKYDGFEIFASCFSTFIHSFIHSMIHGCDPSCHRCATEPTFEGREHASSVSNMILLRWYFGFKFGSHRKFAIINQRHHRSLFVC